MATNGKMSDSRWSSVKYLPLPGGATGTTRQITPQVGTGAETKTHTTTLLAESFGVAVRAYRLIYHVKTAQTGTGNNLALDLYSGTTSVGSLAITTQAALVTATSSVIDSTVAAGGYIRVLVLSTTTASDANAAIGNLSLEYQEQFG